MRCMLILVVGLAVGVLCDEEYTSKYDNVDVDAIIANQRLLRNYVDCLLEKGKCTRDAQELKKHIHDAIDTGCTKCSEKQRNGVLKVVKYLATNKRDWWNELAQKYDPNGVYRAKYADLAKKEGFEL